MTPSTKSSDSRQVGTIWFEKNLTNGSQDGSSDGFVPVRLDHGWRDCQVSRTSVYFDEKSEACYTGRRDFCVGCRRIIVFSYLLSHELCTYIASLPWSHRHLDVLTKYSPVMGPNIRRGS